MRGARRLPFLKRLSRRFNVSHPREMLADAVFVSPVYRMILAGRGPGDPGDMGEFPPDPWPGNADSGRAILGGEFPIPGGRFDVGTMPWGGVAAPPEVTDSLHSFAWLRDLRAADNASASRYARKLVASWIENHGAVSPHLWRADILGRRITAWLANHAFIFGDEEDDDAKTLKPAFYESLFIQSRHLPRVIGRLRGRGEQFAALVAMVQSALVFGKRGNSLPVALKLLERAVDEQILPDGGHIQRSPATHLAVLENLIEARGALMAAHEEVPEALQGAIDRMAPMLRALRHGDGHLALFNGATEDDVTRIDRVLATSGSRSRATHSAPHVGFQRVRGGRNLMIVDCGGPSAGDDGFHAGALSFELSLGKHRLVVNCGSHFDAGSEWRGVLRGTAGHSTLTVNEDDITPLDAPPHGERRQIKVTCDRRQTDGNTLLQMSHDGYRDRYGLMHHRDLYLSATGDDLRGKDELRGPGRGVYAIRFHLHPDVTASLVKGGSAVLLRMHGGGWRFRAAGGTISLRDSIYLGDGRRPRRT
ncbi:MAG: heparinase II/III family protein, partial [Rhodospirillales bacterium]|nr:heparinase II/III family protein [Rhodospirillales bacterium]